MPRAGKSGPGTDLKKTLDLCPGRRIWRQDRDSNQITDLRLRQTDKCPAGTTKNRIMKRIIFIAATAAAISLATLTLSGCSESQAERLSGRIENLIDRAEQNLDSLTDEQWAETEKKFEEFMRQYEKDAKKFTEEQRRRIDKAIGEFEGLQMRRSFKDLSDRAGEAIKSAPDRIEGFINGLIGSDPADSDNDSGNSGSKDKNDNGSGSSERDSENGDSGTGSEEGMRI